MRRFIVRILGDELARERLFQDGLAERIGAGEVGVDFGLKGVSGSKALIENPDDLPLVQQGSSMEREEP